MIQRQRKAEYPTRPNEGHAMSHLIQLWSRTQGLARLVGSGLGLVVAFCVALAVPASADSVADLNRPSSTIPGCVNTWNPLDPKYGGRTCEGQAVAQSWQERATSIITARNVIIDASRDPNRADKETVLGALSTLAAAADAIVSSFHLQPPSQNPFATTLAWMRQQFDAFHMPVPASLGDGFRTLARTLDDPRILIVDRNAVYDRSAIMADALSEAVAETIDPVAQETDAAVLSAHGAAIEAAQAAENGFYNATAAAAAIAKAAGPDHAPIADGQFRVLQASVASHPNQSGYLARTGRKLSAIPDGLWGLLAACAFFALISLKPRMALYGFRAALEGSILFILAARAELVTHGPAALDRPPAERDLAGSAVACALRNPLRRRPSLRTGTAEERLVFFRRLLWGPPGAQHPRYGAF